MDIKFTIKLPPRTKKNSSQLVGRGTKKKIIPSALYLQYEKDAGWFLPKLKEPIDYPINVQAIYYMKTARKVDLCNLHEALCDVLKVYRVVEDDNSDIIYSMDGSRVRYDKENPRTEVIIKEA